MRLTLQLVQYQQIAQWLGVYDLYLLIRRSSLEHELIDVILQQPFVLNKSNIYWQYLSSVRDNTNLGHA